MSDRVHVESVDALKRLRAAMIEFADSIGVALDESDAEVQRTDAWLKRDQPGYLKHQVAVRTELYTRAKSELNRKKLQSSAMNNRPSCVDEVKALARAERALEEARQKQAEVRRWTPLFDQECFGYFAAVQKLRTSAQAGLPRALAHLDAMIAAIEAYAPAPQWQGSTAGTPDEREPGGMARGGDESVSPYSLCTRLRRRSPSATKRVEILENGVAAGAHETRTSTSADTRPDESGRPELIERSILSALLGSARAAPRSSQFAIVAGDVHPPPRLFLVREPATGESDSGWFVSGVKPDASSECSAVRIGDLIAQRPELEPILAFPTGWLIVIDGAAIDVLIDADDAVRWTDGRLRLPEDPSRRRIGGSAANTEDKPDTAPKARDG